jgi:agmatine deiminase
MSKRRRLPAEWQKQDGVLMAWPHEMTDWRPHIEPVERVYMEIAKRITLFERLIVVAPHEESLKRKMQSSGVMMERVRIYEIETNDTWTRDFGPIIVMEDGKPVIVDFAFNGWGLKFPAERDNQVTRRLHSLGAYGDAPMETVGLILEGGSIDSDGHGTIITTAECLLSPNRNPHLRRGEIETALGGFLGADRFLWLESGRLAGDDTDSHVDTLARLCPNDTILYTACDDPNDEHYEVLLPMADQLKRFTTRAGKPYRLIPLPWPVACYTDSGRRIPATYANFLVINGAVLVPIYGSAEDADALHVIGQVFPDRQTIGIDCLPLLLGHGSLHCITMQIPEGVLG